MLEESGLLLVVVALELVLVLVLRLGVELELEQLLLRPPAVGHRGQVRALLVCSNGGGGRLRDVLVLDEQQHVPARLLQGPPGRHLELARRLRLGLRRFGLAAELAQLVRRSEILQRAAGHVDTPRAPERGQPAPSAWRRPRVSGCSCGSGGPIVVAGLALVVLAGGLSALAAAAKRVAHCEAATLEPSNSITTGQTRSLALPFSPLNWTRLPNAPTSSSEQPISLSVRLAPSPHLSLSLSLSLCSPLAARCAGSADPG